MDALARIFSQKSHGMTTGGNPDARPALQDDAYREPTVDEADYYRVLDRIHRVVEPRTYVEVGTRYGESLSLVHPRTQAVAIDPQPEISHPIACPYHLFEMTSDACFETQDLKAKIGGLDVDLSFVDGLHHFENVLRDFAHLERISHPDAIILLHDCIPIDERTARRHRETRLWTGDVWKIVFCLKSERPDLRIDTFDTGPTGICAIQQLDPKNQKLFGEYDRIVNRYISLPFSVVEDEQSRREMLHVCPSDNETIDTICRRKKD